MPRSGYYSPTEAETVKVGIDQDLQAIRFRSERLGLAVTGAGAICTRINEAYREFEEAVGELHGLVDLRTERTEAGARF